MTPAVSVCIPVYNGAPYVEGAIASVLAQTQGDLELIVVDNRSTDGTPELVRAIADPRLRLLEPGEHVSVVPNWTRATAACTGRYVKLVCADDALAPDCLERQVAALEAYPQAALAASQRDIVDDAGRVLVRARGLAGMRGYVEGAEAIARCIRTGSNPLGEPASVLMRGEALRRVGAWRDRFSYMVDLDMWFRLLAHGGLVALPGALAIFRVHGASWSSAVAREQARDTRELHRVWAAAPGTRVSAADRAIGGVQAEVVRVGRRVVSSPAFRRVAGGRA